MRSILPFPTDSASRSTAARRPGRARLAIAGVAIWVVATLLLATASGAPASGSPSVTFTGGARASAANCSWAVLAPIHANATSGLAHLGDQAGARTCGAARGGHTKVSSSSASETLQAVAPLVPPGNGSGGVNLTWALWISTSITDGFFGGSHACPATKYRQVYYSGTYGWTSTTTELADCSFRAALGVTVGAYVEDLTTSNYFWDYFSWSGLSRTASATYDNATQWWNYSNPSYWSLNSSSHWFSNVSSFPAATVDVPYHPAWTINVSWHAKHHYELVTWVTITTSALATQWQAGSNVVASVSMNHGGAHARLLPVVVW